MLENVLTSMIKEILDDPCLDEMARRIETQPIPLYSETDNDNPPGISYLNGALVENAEKLDKLFEDNVKEVNVCEEAEYKRKKMFMEEDSVRFVESILDNTLFNIIQESTHGECDLMKAPRTYISKKK